MTARLFRCNITNTGGAPIVRVGNDRCHGIWSEGSLPGETANTINPGEMGHYQAESDGVMTGTEGWVAFSTTDLDGKKAWFRIHHNLPYWAPKHPGGVGADINSYLYDPTQPAPAAGEFDTRDKTPPNLVITGNGQTVGPDQITQIQSLPWLIVWSVGQIFVRPYGDFHWTLDISVGGGAAPSPEVFPSAQPPATKSQEYRFSNPLDWSGIWVNDDESVTVVISTRSDGLLNVWVSEKSREGGELAFEAPMIPICRANVINLAQAAAEFPAVRKTPGALEAMPTEVVEVRRQGGVKFEDSQWLGPSSRFYERTSSAVRQMEGIAGGLHPRKLGGDFLNLTNDALLEIYGVTAAGSLVGFELRYVRPANLPFVILGERDTRLHHKVVVK